MRFENLLTHLPEVRPESYPIQGMAKTWADYVLSPNRRFAPPPLLEQRPVIPGETSVVIVSAPGAVGKSTLAKAIAYEKRAPLVDLAHRKVAHDSAVGLIVNMFGAGDVARAFSDLQRGELLLVLDALDETKLGSTNGNFDAFLEGLIQLVQAPRQAPVFVLLARVDTADWIELYLAEEGRVPLARVSIDYFDDEGAKGFVSRYVEERSKVAGFGPVDTSDRPFVDVRDQLLGAIEDAVAAEDDAETSSRNVTGYAPVLEAVGEYLLEEESRKNFYRLLQALQREGREWELLLQVAEAILEREQGKVADSISKRLQPIVRGQWSDWAQVYSPEEQVRRLLADRFAFQPPVLPITLPTKFRHEYEEAVTHALTEHPFRGTAAGLHPVFGDYLYALVLADQSGIPSSARSTVLEGLRSGTYLPTRALGRFVLALSARTGLPRVRGNDFGFVYESVLSDRVRADDVKVAMSATTGEDQCSAWIDSPAGALELTVTRTMEGIWLWRHLVHAHIAVDCSVELGADGREFGLGPAAYVNCSQIRCRAMHLRVYLGDDQDGDEVVLLANTFNAMSEPIRTYGTGFHVHGGEVPWPWSVHHKRETTPPEARPEIVELYNHLSRMLLWFRAAGYDEMRRVGDLVEKAATGGTDTARDLLRFCVERGLIRKGRLYELNEEVLAGLGIHYVDLRRRELRIPIIEFLEDFLRWRGTE